MQLIEAQVPEPLPGHFTLPPAKRAEPDDPELAAMAIDAYDRWRTERWEKFVDDIDIGEAIEHLAVNQNSVEAGNWGVDQLFLVGDEIFESQIRAIDGFGRGQGLSHGRRPHRAVRTQIRRVHDGMLGGPDTGSCNDCHHRGGLDGAGDLTQNAFVQGDGYTFGSALERNPPPVIGLGVIELLAQEMTTTLQSTLRLTAETAKNNKKPIEANFWAKGVYFGRLAVSPDGTFDPSALRGVDKDLVVKPFGWKGNHPTLRTFGREALQAHHGLLAEELVDEHKQDGKPEVVGEGPDYDPDKDGTYTDISRGQLTALQVYLALLEVPAVKPPESSSGNARYLRGLTHFTEFGCAECHKPYMILENDTYVIPPVQKDGKELSFKLSEHMEEPKLRRDEPYAGGYVVRAFTDLKRHDMGRELADPRDSGTIPASQFRTPALWGLAESAPYLHDGRAANVDEAILMHGGAGERSAKAFKEASAEQQTSLRVFLMSLTRVPRVVYK